VKALQSDDPLNAWLWKTTIGGSDRGLLAGKTVSYKDHIAVAGVPMSFGTFGLDGFIPDFDATVVTRVLQAGGQVIGKNVMDGLSGGYGMGGGIGDYGRVLNPHNPDHVTGGSSSGSGAAVASGQVDISFGGDQGGSIRIPAAFCGTLGLKPTFGLLSHFGLGFGSDQSIDYTGPMTRTVEDAAAALQATAGYDVYDPRQRREVPLSLDVLSGLDYGVSGLRIGILEEAFGDDSADPEVKDLVLAAVDMLARAGARVKRVSVPAHLEVRTAQQALGAEGALAVFKTGFYGAFTRTYYPAGLLSAINTLWADHADVLAPRTRLNLVTGDLVRKNYSGRVYAKAQNVRPTYIKAYDDVLIDVDILAMPTATIAAPRNDRPATMAEALERNLSMMNRLGRTMNTQQFNFTGHPALAVPIGKTSAGLPASIQLVGRFFDDPLLLRAAYAYQHSVDWADVIRVGELERVPVFA
jgi:amidase